MSGIPVQMHNQVQMNDLVRMNEYSANRLSQCPVSNSPIWNGDKSCKHGTGLICAEVFENKEKCLQLTLTKGFMAMQQLKRHIKDLSCS
jgi:hypothetical protein